MLVIRDIGPVSAKQASSLADKLQRVLKLEAQVAGYELRSFEVQLDRPNCSPSKSELGAPDHTRDKREILRAGCNQEFGSILVAHET